MLKRTKNYNIIPFKVGLGWKKHKAFGINEGLDFRKGLAVNLQQWEIMVAGAVGGWVGYSCPILNMSLYHTPLQIIQNFFFFSSLFNTLTYEELMKSDMGIVLDVPLAYITFISFLFD